MRERLAIKCGTRGLPMVSRGVHEEKVGEYRNSVHTRDVWPHKFEFLKQYCDGQI